MKQPASLPGSASATQGARATPTYRGRVDRMDSGVIEGWALVGDGATPAELEVILDGELLGVAVADNPRKDLIEKGIGTGRHGFRFLLPEGVTLESASAAPVLMFRNTGVPLRVPIGQKGRRSDPVMARLDSVLAAVLALGQIVREQKQRGVRADGQQGADLQADLQADLRDIHATLQRLESILCIGLAQSMRDHVAAQTAGLVRADLKRELRVLKRMGLLTLTLIMGVGIGIGLGLMMVLTA